MTMYEAWLEECKRNKQQVWVLESGIDQEDRVVKLIKLITVIEPTKENGWHEYYDTSYILWQGDSFRNTNGYIMGLNSFKVACSNNVDRNIAKQKLNNLYGKVVDLEEGV